MRTRDDLLVRQMASARRIETLADKTLDYGVDGMRMVLTPEHESSFEELLLDWYSRQTAYGRIAGTGSYVPEGRLTNQDLQKLVETTPEWIQTRTGIGERRVVGEGQAASDLALPAARRALESARVGAEEIDLIVVATVTPDTWMPSTACWLQARLKCRRAIAFDVNAACSGFVYALSIADNFIRAGKVKSALVVGVDVFSKIVNYQDRGTCLLFGDGAGAVVLEATTGDSRVLSTHLYADGSGAKALEVPAGGSRLPACHETVERGLHTVTMPSGQEIFRSAVRGMTEAVQAALDENKVTVADLTLLIPHQANIRILEAVGERLGVDRSRLFTNLERYGNTSAASIPLALDEASRGGRLAPGDLVMLTAFGAGFTWGSALVRWG
ncbi:MAG TPA: beta-ketoacyl-ACP synthase III [Thermoanaerobaculia bacterium]|jgi:3-oxoacyl-[acyl-carrier-protein] synthase-3|nr:beta-ketoacyl-ACP synthase III [Thermoanaerobaculia bacterium]